MVSVAHASSPRRVAFIYLSSNNLLCSNASEARRFCHEHECPANWNNANEMNCCVYHANIHSCPLGLMVGTQRCVLQHVHTDVILSVSLFYYYLGSFHRTIMCILYFTVVEVYQHHCEWAHNLLQSNRSYSMISTY